MMTRRLVVTRLLAALAPPPPRMIVVLHLDQELAERCRIAQHSRNQPTLEAWITTTIAEAVSDCSILPGGCHVG